jgi:hypothetical protein
MATSVLGQCPEHCSCSAVYTVNCIKSSLTELPVQSLNKHLTKLNASFNDITILNKDSLKDIPMLIHLNLSYNKITSVDSQAFSSLKNLHSLDLSSNNITSIESATFMYNKELKWLSLADNRMFRLPNKGELYLTQLLFFNISHCNIQNIPSDTFSNIRELRELYLENNKIVSLNRGVFLHLTRLQKLDLCYNALQNIDGHVFSRLRNLISLSLCHNYVSRINITLLEAVVKIGNVNLEGNPWICDCDSADVYYKCAKKDNCNLNLICAFPDHFKESHWDVIDKLGCVPPVSPTIVGEPPEAETVTTMHQTTTEQINQTKFSDQISWYWIAMILSVIFLIMCVVIVMLLVIIRKRNCERIRRRNCERFRNEIQELGESCSSGGFNSTHSENEDNYQQREMRKKLRH